MKNKISVYIITKNEEVRLLRTLEAIRSWADEIIVVDSGSTDATVEIARGIADKVVHHDWVSYSDQKHFAEELCAYEWRMMLDADEVVSESLKEELLAWKLSEPTHKAYRIKVVDIFPGETKPPMFSRVYNDIRLYHRDYAWMDPGRMTNDRITLKQSTEIGQIKERVWHYSYLSLSQVIAKGNKYTDDVQAKYIAKGRKVFRVRLFTEVPLNFLRYYFARRGFVHGSIGFISAVAAAYMRWVKIAKAVEREERA